MKTVQKTATSLAFACISAGLALSGCASTTTKNTLPTGPAAYQAIEAASTPAPTGYFISPTDLLSISVFGEPELTKDGLRVDDAGFIQLPLAGQLKAEGKTAVDLSDEISTRLRKSYLVDPRVTVSVKEAGPRTISVEGDVNKPGVYEISGTYTLLSALARAESPTNTAKLSEVIVFRTINGQRAAARFNVADIRGGVAPDPQIMNGDVIMVGSSSGKRLWQDILRAAPIFNAFVQLGRY